MSSLSKAKAMVVIGFLGLLALHVLFCFILTVFPQQKYLKGRLVYLYKVYALPGPFFKDEFIQSSPHFYLSCKIGSQNWTPWVDHEKANFLDYHLHSWRYTKLKQGAFERYLARNLGKKMVKDGVSRYSEYNEFKTLHSYFADRYIPVKADSIRQLYTLNQYNDKTGLIKLDTVFYLKYKAF